MTPEGLLTGDTAVERFKSHLEDAETLDTYQYARVDYAEVVYKEGDAESIGPWGYTHFNHEDLREVRTVGMVISWLMGDDYKFNNVRLDVLEVDDDEWDIIHVMSDVGSGIKPDDPGDVSWTVRIEPDGPLFHNNRNNFSTKAFDLMTWEDATWAVRRIGRLSEEQITAAFAAGSMSWPVTRLYIEKFIARRDDLVGKFELASELGLLRPEGPDKNLTVTGDGVLRFENGGEILAVTIPRGPHEVIDGEVRDSES